MTYGGNFSGRRPSLRRVRYDLPERIRKRHAVLAIFCYINGAWHGLLRTLAGDARGAPWLWRVINGVAEELY